MDEQLTDITGHRTGIVTDATFNECMHWLCDWYREPETVTKVCLLCGATGTAARCQARYIKGGQCRSYLVHGICGTHGG